MGNGLHPWIIGRLLETGCRVPARVSRGEVDLLRRLVAEEDTETGEQLTSAHPGGWWLSDEQVSPQVCFRLLRHCFISADGEESGGIQYWRINETGREALKDQQ